jgi:hypothetical protein
VYKDKNDLAIREAKRRKNEKVIKMDKSSKNPSQWRFYLVRPD